jgi:drug/metabolite transporter (DMT)-like permease
MITKTDYLKLHFIVFLWGFTAILGKLITLPSVEMVFYRTLLAAFGMGALMLMSGNSFALTRSDLLKLILTGFIIAIHWLTFFVSGKISNASTSLVGFATCSLWTALLEPLIKRQKIQLIEVGLGVIVLSGLSIIFAFDFQYKLGLFLGVASGFTIAIVGVINSKIVSRVSSFSMTFYEMTGACLGVLLFFPFYINFWATGQHLSLSPTAMDWLYLAIIAWACSVYAYSVAIDLLKKFSVFFVQLTLNLEPLYGIILALLIFGKQEVLGINFYLGAAVILSAVVIYPLIKGRTAKI